MQDTVATTNNPVTYWDPFAMTRQLMSWTPSLLDSATPTHAAFVPRLEISETDDAYVVLADVPGIAADDLDVTVTGRQLSIAGERRAQDESRTGTYYVHERSYGRFTRTVTLPSDADEDSVQAELDDGVLQVTIGKRASAKPRKISLAQRIKNKLTS